ncbi:MAG TPA: metalloregulator ArsR/SmtB family transcription factor [Trebonia sp.]|nr:metalloregulator ArsR/SmtB family transcription factor [Trebonia sp.]
MSREPVVATEVFKALSDPIRWNIVQQVARQDEFACSILEETLPVSKPTISYHTKVLIQAGVIAVHKRGRHYFYSLRRDVLRGVIDEVLGLSPGPATVTATSDAAGTGAVAGGDAGRAPGPQPGGPSRPAPGAPEADPLVTLLTW